MRTTPSASAPRGCRRPAERHEILSLLQSQRKRLADGWLSVREIATGDATRLPELPPRPTPQDAAAWTLVGGVIAESR